MFGSVGFSVTGFVSLGSSSVDGSELDSEGFVESVVSPVGSVVSSSEVGSLGLVVSSSDEGSLGLVVSSSDEGSVGSTGSVGVVGSVGFTSSYCA